NNGFGRLGCVAKAGSNCTSNPCAFGTCFSSAIAQNGYTCQCFPGYSGLLCDVANDECKSNPCKNGATCIDLDNGFLCVCSVNWKGKTCEQTRDTCGGRFYKREGYIKYPLSTDAGITSGRKCTWRITTTFSKFPYR
ncbi:Cubilin-like protein, partial [Leptotrombidium deliense]